MLSIAIVQLEWVTLMGEVEATEHHVPLIWHGQLLHILLVPSFEDHQLGYQVILNNHQGLVHITVCPKTQ